MIWGSHHARVSAVLPVAGAEKFVRDVPYPYERDPHGARIPDELSRTSRPRSVWEQSTTPLNARAALFRVCRGGARPLVEIAFH
jgi:hypothetical protein